MSDSDSSLDLDAMGIKMESADTKRRREALKAKAKTSVPISPAVVAATEPKESAPSAPLSVVAEVRPDGPKDIPLAVNVNVSLESDKYSTDFSAHSPAPIRSHLAVAEPQETASTKPSAVADGGVTAQRMVPPLPLTSVVGEAPSHPHPPHADRPHSPPEEAPSEEEDGVWLCDRGIQTECTTETQTDPEPPMALCPVCLVRHAGGGAPGPNGVEKDRDSLHLQMMMMLRAQLDDVQRTLWKLQGGAGR